MPDEEREGSDDSKQCGGLVTEDSNSLLHHHRRPQEDGLNAKDLDNIYCLSETEGRVQ